MFKVPPSTSNFTVYSILGETDQNGISLKNHRSCKAINSNLLYVWGVLYQTPLRGLGGLRVLKGVQGRPLKSRPLAKKGILNGVCSLYLATYCSYSFWIFWQVIIIRTYGHAFLWPRRSHQKNYSIVKILKQKYCKISVGHQKQGESVALVPDGHIYYVHSEFVNQPLWKFDIDYSQSSK